MICEKTFNSRLGFGKEPICLDGEKGLFDTKEEAFQAIIRAYEKGIYSKGQLGMLNLD